MPTGTQGPVYRTSLMPSQPPSEIQTRTASGLPREQYLTHGTERRQRILDFVREHLRVHVIPPTLDEIGDATGMVKSVVWYHLNVLVEQEKLIRLTTGQTARSIVTPEVAAAVRSVQYKDTV